MQATKVLSDSLSSMKIIALLCLLSFSPSLFSQDPVVIEYEDMPDFTWTLFQGKINKDHIDEMGSNTGAVTVSSLSYTTKQTSPEAANIRITARFHPKESWTRYPNLTRQAEALSHEKGHLDITEIYARRIRKMMHEERFTTRGFKSELDHLFKKMAQQHRAEQVKYDKETDHCMDVPQQLKWDSWISTQLELLSAYTDPNMKIQLH